MDLIMNIIGVILLLLIIVSLGGLLLVILRELIRGEW